MVEAKIVNFPLNRNRRNAASSGDDILAAEIGKAWRKLWRTIRAAQAAGLHVQTNYESNDTPKITRHY